MRPCASQAAIDTTSRARRRRAVATALLPALVACGSITPARMVPDSAAAAERPIAMQVHVRPVTGARTTSFGGAPYPSNEALMQTCCWHCRR